MLEQNLVEIAKTIPPELVTFILAMLPVTELRGSIPFAMTALDLDPWTAFIFSLMGNISISIIIFFLLGPITKFLRKHSKQADRFFKWLFKRTRSKHFKKMSELGHIALLLFVAVPLPGSGGWTGALVAYLFDVKARATIPIIIAALILSGLIITFGSGILINLFS